ncbi:hypothetical protein [Haloarcula nitratireducens]|uniref:Uncharacterized protein n=1 Tax=Haloarcula nitratireducens TaxID=2487749 RepID=A0AAW4PGA7_9EURY|nr:hypothetical protein [Halomicroarcula nitratireducens]MBX0296918.1 hypothetical protein [Halomicroarcula nitratireducens]
MSSQSPSNRALFAAFVVDIILIVGYAISALVPDHRLWPIDDSKWRWWVNWSALSVVFAEFPMLTYRD